MSSFTFQLHVRNYRMSPFWTVVTWRKRGHSSFLLLFAGFLTGFYGNTVLCQEPHELPSEGFATTF